LKADPASNSDINRATVSVRVATKPDLCVALDRSIETSRGTKERVKQALAAGIAVYLAEDSRGIPRRVQTDDPRLA
jgi:hypothetical protein